MIASAKSLVFALLALMLSVGHNACACASVSLAHGSMTMAAMTDGHASHDTHSDHDRAPCDGENAYCPHCAAMSVADVAVNAPTIVVLAQAPHPEAVPLTALAIPPPANQWLFQRLYSLWRPPPIRTPVSLKVRFLN